MDENFKNYLVNYYKSKNTNREFIPCKSFVPVSGKVFDEKEVLSMVEAVLDGWWTEGRFAEEMERKLANFLGVKYAALVNSGSSANLVAISALTSMKLEDKRLKPGDEVITVAAGFPTTINPIIQNNLVPVFVDIDLGTYNANIEQIKQAIGPKTRAIFLAHTLGNPYDLDEIVKLCEENNLWFIEDGCDALGSTFNGKKTGTFGHISTCSFYPAHHITMGEGGAVFTNNSLLFKIIKSIRDWGRDCWCKTGADDTCKQRFCWQLGNLPQGYDHKYTYSEIGYNLKVTDMQASLGVAQMEKLEGFIQKRKENFKYLYDGLKKYDEYFILPKWSEKADPSWFGFLLTVKNEAGFERDDLVKFLNEKKIGSRLLFAGNVTKQPYFIERNVNYRAIGDLKNTDIVMNNTFWIGVYPGLDKEMLNYVLDCFSEFFNIQNKKPLLSVCIPTYNRAQGLKKNLELITSQFISDNFLTEVEIVISDNHSNDNTKEIVESFSKKYTNILYYVNDLNVGFDRNVDKVLKKANGMFCWLLSDDDFIENWAIGYVLDVLHKNINVACVSISDSDSLKEIKYFCNGNELLLCNGLKGGLLSQIILKRCLIPKDSSKYYGNYWFHFSVFLEMVAKQKSILIKNVLEPKKNEECRWAVNGLSFTTYVCLKKIVEYLPNFGYDNKLIENILNDFARGLPKKIASAKLHGLNFSIGKIVQLIREFKSYYFYLFISLIVFLTPTVFLRNFKFIYGRFSK